MDFRRPLATLLLLAGPAAAQTSPAARPPAPATATASATPAVPPATTPAPMPDPLMSPDLQGKVVRPPNLASLVQQSTWQDPVIAAARTQAKQLPDACAAASFKPTGELTIYAPPQFDATGTLVRGIWNERVVESGCGANHLLNVLTVLQPGSAPSRIPTMPGSTHADPATQKSALQYAQAIAIRASPPNCKQQSFYDTRFDGYTGLPDLAITDGRDGRAWREEWSLFACGSTYSIEMMFTPNAQGTQLVATNPVKRS